MSGSALSILAIVAAVLFVATLTFAAFGRTRVAGEYVGTGFHLLLLPLINALPGSFATKGVGLAWIACDVVAATGAIWTEREASKQSAASWTAVRMAGHLFAAIWIATASTALGTLGLVSGSLLAFGFHCLHPGRRTSSAVGDGCSRCAHDRWLLVVARHFQEIAS